MEQYIPKSAVVAKINNWIQDARSKYTMSKVQFSLSDRIESLENLLSFLDTLEVKEVNEKSETACRSEIIKVKCISPFDETWEKGKIYTGEKWHHGYNLYNLK